MTKKLYSLDEIEDAILCPENWDCVGTHVRQADLDKILLHVKNRLTYPQPEFREGQVVVEPNGHYGKFSESLPSDSPYYGIGFIGCRPLTLEEVGPHLYVPIEDVRPLVAYIRDNQQFAVASKIFDALPDNLKALIDAD